MNWRIAHTHDRETAAVINRPPYPLPLSLPSSPPILKLNSHFSYDSLLSFGSRERTRQFRYSSCGARNDGSSIGGEESKTLAPAFLQPGMRLAVTLPCELRIIGWYFFIVKGVLIDDEV